MTLSSRYTPCAAVASTRESISLAVNLKEALTPSASNAVITMEYGSSPVEAALHQTRQLADGLERRCDAKISK